MKKHTTLDEKQSTFPSSVNSKWDKYKQIHTKSHPSQTVKYKEKTLKATGKKKNTQHVYGEMTIKLTANFSSIIIEARKQ